MPESGIAFRNPETSHKVRATTSRGNTMMIVDKSGFVHFVPNKAAAARTAQEVREAQK